MTTAAPPLPHRKVVRSSGARLVGGVASGIAEHLGLSPFVVRLAFVALSIAGGVGFAMYAAFWLLLPQSAARPDGAARREVFRPTSLSRR